MFNKEKFYITTIILLVFLAFYFVFIHKQKVEIRFLKPVYPVGNCAALEKPDNEGRRY